MVDKFISRSGAGNKAGGGFVFATFPTMMPSPCVSEIATEVARMMPEFVVIAVPEILENVVFVMVISPVLSLISPAPVWSLNAISSDMS